MRNSLGYGFLIAVICLAGCELFNNLPETDLEKKMDEAIAWAKAEKLTSTTMATPEGWVNSSNPGEGRITSIDIRKGYLFTVECVPSSAYVFEQWMAFLTEDYNGFTQDDFGKTAAAMEARSISHDSSDDVKIDPITDGTGQQRGAEITINTTEPVTLVPWCGERPVVVETNPPLINTGFSYKRNQSIRITFSGELKYTEGQTIPIGEEYIQIKGRSIDDMETEIDLLNYGPDSCFYEPEYSAATSRGVITISAKSGAEAPPEDMFITVTVGTGIKGKNGTGLAAPVYINYRTNAEEEIKRVYVANYVWAIQDPESDPADNFFYRGELVTDRRLREQAPGEYGVSLYFTVTASRPEDMDSFPDSLQIAEVYYAELDGAEINSLTVERPVSFSIANDEAASYYRSNNTAYTSGTVYKAEYTWTEANLPAGGGIIRLVVLPYRDTGDAYEDVPPERWDEAMRGTSFVAVVYDNQPPGGSASLTLDGQASINNGVYNYNSENNEIVINPDFSGIRDNNGAGRTTASMNFPRTMDDQASLEWQYRIVNEGSETTLISSPWLALNSDERIQSLTTLSSSTGVRVIQVQYRDSLGNESGWSASLGRLRYYDSARDVWAIHNPTASSVAGDFFWQEAPLERDRRLRGTATAASVTLFFYIPGTESSSLPDMVKIAEIDYAALQGSDSNRLIRQRDFDLTPMTAATGANNVYMSGKPAATSVSYYRVTYQWNATNPAGRGIIRLAVMPYKDGETFVDNWQAAVEEGRFVTVVFDDLAPGGGASLALGGEDYKDGDIYIFNPNAPTLSIQPNFTGIQDNNGVGIPLEAATANKPRTMDTASDCEWQYRIVDRGTSTALVTSGWYSLDLAEVTRDLSASPALATSSTTIRDIQVQYRDSLGNVSGGWSASLGSIKYDSILLSGISTWSASYNETGNSIDLTWTKPADVSSVEIRVNGELRQTSTVTSYTAPAAGPLIDVSGVTSGRPVGNVMEYEISLTAVYPNGRAAPREFKIWNIPGMVNSSAYPLEEISTQAQFDEMALNDVNGKYVLVNDITIADSQTWTPLGTGTGATNAFQGKFYGNGHTITLDHSSGDGFPSDAQFVGIFGAVFGESDEAKAEIRDLTVQYNNNATAGAATASYIGGITGFIGGFAEGGFAEVSNCIVKGQTDVSLNVTSTSTSTICLGGIAGYMYYNAAIKNCYAGLDVRLISNSNAGVFEGVFAGGAVGYIANTGTVAAELLSDIRVTGNVTCLKGGNYTGSMYAGGVVGYCSGTNTLEETENLGKMVRLTYSGTLTAGRNAGTRQTGDLNVGGIGGYISYPRLEDCEFERSGKIIVSNGSSGNDNSTTLRIGGIVGYLAYGAAETSLLRCNAWGDITVRSGAQTVYAGGVAGSMSGNVWGGIQYRTFLTNCVFEQGALSVQAAAATDTYIGGVVGNSTAYGNLQACYSRPASIDAKVTAGNLYFGGFIGTMTSTSITGCGSTGSVIMSDTNTGAVYIGGFMGRLDSNNGGLNTIVDCWSRGDVSSRGSGSILRTGGFLGSYSITATTVLAGTLTRCYATGDVTAEKFGSTAIDNTGGFATGGLGGFIQKVNVNQSWASGTVIARMNLSATATGSPYAGGLAGYFTNIDNAIRVSISNCYALGNVLVDDPRTTFYTGNLYAGGLVGYMVGVTGIAQNPRVQYCFAAGSVTAQSASTSGKATYAGGVLGQNSTNGSLDNSAALGANVTVKTASATRNAGRVYGGGSTTAATYNYAKESMRIEKSDSYSTLYFGATPWTTGTEIFPNYTFTMPTTSFGATFQNGETVADSVFKSQYIWNDSSRLSFSATYWNFGSAAGKGYPTLLGVGGQ